MRALARVERGGVSPLLTSDDQRVRFRIAIDAASRGLVDYREWLKQNLPNMRQDSALGDKAYDSSCTKLPYCLTRPEQLLTMARQDFQRVLAMESYEHQRDLRHRN